MNTKTEIIATIRRFINSRPNFDSCNYSDATSYRADLRTAAKDRAAALHILAAIEARDTITAADMLDPAHNYGRFTLKTEGKTIRAEYIAGQYYPTEYRAGIARYLSGIFWDYLREHATPADATGHDIRKAAALALGKPIARRFFN